MDIQIKMAVFSLSFIKNGLLVFRGSSKKLDDTAWVSYISSPQ